MMSLDRKLIFSGANRFWTAGTGLVTALVLTQFLSPAEQGYYYTFLSLGALQIFVEMGLGYAVTQIAANECADVNLEQAVRTNSAKQVVARMSSLLRYVLTYFLVAMLLLVVLLATVGLITLNAARPDHQGTDLLI